MDKYITVNQLLEFCKKEVKAGNWDKHILITSDDEGNEYHWLFYAFNDDYDEIKQLEEFWMIHDNDLDLENVILLG